ncbi:MAG: AAA family ATPase, partial [Chitinivibrionales bacterium]|nr:AAA family ATPase [Chitinivibrionales bacterium]
MIIRRQLEKSILKTLFKGKTVVIYGARQTGKTTLVKKIVSEQPNAAYFLCEEPDIAAALSGKTSSSMKAFLGNHKLIVLDEAQRLPEP